jgi:predicted GIY-YIG superfamily endonuclease
MGQRASPHNTEGQCRHEKIEKGSAVAQEKGRVDAQEKESAIAHEKIALSHTRKKRHRTLSEGAVVHNKGDAIVHEKGLSHWVRVQKRRTGEEDAACAKWDRRRQAWDRMRYINDHGPGQIAHRHPARRLRKKREESAVRTREEGSDAHDKRGEKQKVVKEDR